MEQGNIAGRSRTQNIACATNANAWMKFFHCTLCPIGTVAGSINRSD